MQNSKSIEFHEITRRELDDYFDKLYRKRKRSYSGKPFDQQVRIHSEKYGLDYRYVIDETSNSFHIASIGKMFTAVLIHMLTEEGKLTLDTPITSYLDSTIVKNLFVYHQQDYADQVTVEHLLNHTSGVADYFSDPVNMSTTFMQEIVNKPDKRWTPAQLIDFTRNHQQPLFRPGEGFHYSDTGYVLLGMIVEHVTGMSFGQQLQERFFFPLGMKHTYLMFHTSPLESTNHPIAPIWFNRTEISKYESLSCDWAGGGIVSTADDLLLFYKALRKGKLISESAMQKMEKFSHKFYSGLYYGQGMMETRFEHFFFLLRGWPRLRGHIGILSTHLFYDPKSDSYIVMNFGANDELVRSFRALIRIVGTLRKSHS